MIFTIVSFFLSSILSLLNVHFAVSICQAITRFRQCVKENTSGGYYQQFTLAEHVAVRYLKYEILVEALPQGGYNVHPFSFFLREKLRNK